MLNGLSGFIEKYAKILVVIAVIFGATSGTLGKAMRVPPIAIGFWRLGMSLPFFAIPVFTKRRKELKEISGSNLLRAIAAGIILCAHFTFWFSAVKTTTIASASILGVLHPLAVLAISILFYKKKIGLKPILGIVVALIGAALTAGFDYGQLTREHFIGDLFALGAAICMGTYFAIGEKARESVEGNVYVFLLFTSCWLSFLVIMIVTGTSFFDYSLKDFFYLVLMTLLCQIGSHALLNLCLGHTSSVFVSACGTSDCIFSIFFAFVFLGQIPSVWALLGCAIVVMGLLYYNRHADE